MWVSAFLVDVFVNWREVRGGAGKSIARPTSRCSRTESIVSSERGICSCAELQVFSCYRGWKEACQATRAISTTSRRELSSSFFFLQGKTPKQIHSILINTIGERACIKPYTCRTTTQVLSHRAFIWFKVESKWNLWWKKLHLDKTLFPPYLRTTLSNHFTTSLYSSIHTTRTIMSLFMNIHARRPSV